MQSADFIVIGAGSAGCVVAGRLAEAGHKVLLIEAGGADRNPWIHIPLGYARLYANPNVNWCYESEPEPFLNYRKLFQPRGKVLGGTGSINGMIYMRGQPEDFNAWADLGCEGWSWPEVLTYFKKSEDQQRGADQFHGVGGPVSVSDLPSRHQLGEDFHTASEKLGSPPNDDFNGATQLGTGYVQTTTRNSRRWSTAAGYLRNLLNAEQRANLQVVKSSLVEKVIVKDGRAAGVVWRNGGGCTETRADREIILSAGVFGSPQILKLSGIGPAEELKRHGIAVAANIRDVGENLQDHFGIGIEYMSRTRRTVNDMYNNPLIGSAQLLRYLLTGSGPFADNGNYSNTFIRTRPDIQTPDMMVTFMAWCTGEDLKPHPFSGFTILAEHIRPDARGYVRLKSRQPGAMPAIRFNFLQSEADREAALAGLKYARKIGRTEPMARHVKAELSPGPTIGDDDEALIEHCRSNGLSLLHAVGTCRMGVGDNAVVDPRLRLRGVEGLRVADASVMPRIVSGNTNAATIMIGEKAAAMILEDAQ